MSRRLRGIIMSLIVAMLLLALLAWPKVANRAQAPAWRLSLDDYARTETARGAGSVAVIATGHAARPWGLTRELGLATYGDSAHFATDRGPKTHDGRPVPYPPEDVWCALLERSQTSTGNAARQVVLVALHADLYNADWILHEGPVVSDTNQLAGQLAAVGCVLPGGG